ncbi:MAG: helicase-related protein [Bacteroides fragilis]
MMDKVHMVQKKNDGKGVVFATGTPITNSITDAYIMQQYLQSGELAMLDLQSFDAWIGMFAERSTEFEIDVDTSSYRLATRFAKFHNLPELTSLLSSIADFHQVDESAGIPMHDGYNDALVSKTSAFASYLDDISQRADDVRQGRVSRKDDNMLKITTDGRKAALDLRLVDQTATFTYQSKVARCAENVADIYFKNAQSKATQLIFCDTSTPKTGFNIYDELKTGLINLGIPETQIAYIHDAETETKRAQLFMKVRNGDIRILIGSTFKLGLGVNIQDKLIALHHIDVPWRPADMTQREGRILRQGNTNTNVYIYRYITEGSFDAYSWQLLETKQRFISDLLSGSLTARSGADIEDTVLDYAEVKALAVGNPLVKKRVEAANELTRYLTLQRKLVDSRIRMEKELMELPGKLEHQKELIAKCEEDLSYYQIWKAANPPAEENRLKKEEAEKRKALRKYITSAVKSYALETREKILVSYRGFDIVLPANMTHEKPYVWLTRQGKYYVELGDTEIGNLVRIDNYLDTLDDHLEKLKTSLSQLTEKEIELKAELAKDENYSEQIEKYRAKVEKIDKKLGVDKK